MRMQYAAAAGGSVTGVQHVSIARVVDAMCWRDLEYQAVSSALLTIHWYTSPYAHADHTSAVHQRADTARHSQSRTKRLASSHCALQPRLALACDYQHLKRRNLAPLLQHGAAIAYVVSIQVILKAM